MKAFHSFVLSIPYLFLKKIPYAWVPVVALWAWPPIISGIFLAMNEASGPIFKIKDDPRLTGVGRLIRRLSLDELPQLYNILVGNMTLVLNDKYRQHN